MTDILNRVHFYAWLAVLACLGAVVWVIADPAAYAAALVIVAAGAVFAWLAKGVKE